MKYMTKDGNKVQSILPVASAALRKMQKYPSVAEDQGSDYRNTTHLLNILLNSTRGNQEIGGQTAALAVLGFPSNIFSHPFAFLFVRPATKYLKSHNDSRMDDDDDSDRITTSSNNLLEALGVTDNISGCIDDINVDIDLDADADLMADDNDEDGVREIIPSSGEAPSEIVTVAQFEHYLHRCADNDDSLRDFTY